MLTAYKGDSLEDARSREKVYAHEEVRDTSSSYFCWGCSGKMSLKKGMLMVHHFAHISTDNCPQSGTGESLRHMRIKTAIYNALKKRDVPAILEYDCGGPIADVMFKLDGKYYVIEIQISAISMNDVQRRTVRYNKLGYYVLWLRDFQSKEEQIKKRDNKRGVKDSKGLVNGQEVQINSLEWWLHGAYDRMVYYWRKGLTVAPIHYQYTYTKGRKISRKTLLAVIDEDIDIIDQLRPHKSEVKSYLYMKYPTMWLAHDKVQFWNDLVAREGYETEEEMINRILNGYLKSKIKDICVQSAFDDFAADKETKRLEREILEKEEKERRDKEEADAIRKELYNDAVVRMRSINESKRVILTLKNDLEKLSKSLIFREGEDSRAYAKRERDILKLTASIMNKESSLAQEVISHNDKVRGSIEDDREKNDESLLDNLSKCFVTVEIDTDYHEIDRSILERYAVNRSQDAKSIMIKVKKEEEEEKKKYYVYDRAKERFNRFLDEYDKHHEHHIGRLRGAISEEQNKLNSGPIGDAIHYVNVTGRIMKLMADIEEYHVKYLKHVYYHNKEIIKGIDEEEDEVMVNNLRGLLISITIEDGGGTIDLNMMEAMIDERVKKAAKLRKSDKVERGMEYINYRNAHSYEKYR